MRVLVLRPQPAADRTAGRLAARGHEAVLLPLARAVHDRAAARTALAGGHAAIAITSAEAGGLLREAPAGHETVPVFAVGHASARAAREAGFRRVETPGGDGRALADFILQRREALDLAAGPLLYLAGHPRAPGFESRLAEAGLPLRTVECYRMEPLSLAPEAVERAVLGAAPDAVLLHSPESARRFFALPFSAAAEARLHAASLLCMSANVAAAIPETFAARVRVAARPDEESLLDLLQSPVASG